MYNSFTGIDIGKFTFVVFVSNSNKTQEYENTSKGIQKFISEYKSVLKTGLSILETTGGYEIELLYTLCDKGFKVHRADTKKVKNFIRSFGNAAKTDALDAKALAKYGQERHSTLELFTPRAKKDITLFRLVQRKSDLKQMLVAEKNRIQNPGSECIQDSFKKMIEVISEQIDDVTSKIEELVESDPALKKRREVLKSIPGIGDIVSLDLLILLPELGRINRKKIAALVGLAPLAKDSGIYRGYRRTCHGRNGVKPILFLAAMAARNSKSNLKTFYESLIKKGKKKMVALVALMRKILVIANARLNELGV